LVLVGGVLVITFWEANHQSNFCPPGFHLPGAPAPWVAPFDFLRREATIPLVVIFLAGAWISLGARGVGWRWVGLALSGFAVLAGLAIGQPNYSPCM